jgi:uncharacterized protein YggE
MMHGQEMFSTALAMAAVVGVLAIAPLNAQDRAAAPVPNTIWVGADGKFESEPDTALVQFNIAPQEKKLADAMQKATSLAEQVRQLLRSNGIDPKDAQFSRFATQPAYEYNNGQQKLVGYRVDASISVKVKDFSKIGPISEGLGTMEVTNTSITYTLENTDAAKLKAVEDAMRRTREEATAVAQFAGRTLGELSHASVDTFEPQPIRPMMAKAMMSTAQAAPAAPTEGFGAEKITVTAHVNALYGMK